MSATDVWPTKMTSQPLRPVAVASDLQNRAQVADFLSTIAVLAHISSLSSYPAMADHHPSLSCECSFSRLDYAHEDQELIPTTISSFEC